LGLDFGGALQAAQDDLPSNNCLQHEISAVHDEFWEDLSISLKNTKNEGFSLRPSGLFSLADSTR
jgi:hypothetical protein